MDSNYFNSKKYIILLVIVCSLFAILTAKVFDYMPQPVDNQEYNRYYPSSLKTELKNQNNEQINDEESLADEDADEDEDDEDDDDEDNIEDEQEDNYNQHQKSGHIDFMPKTTEFDEIPAPKGAVEEVINAENNTPIIE